jgi:hypothetical protein
MSDKVKYGYFSEKQHNVSLSIPHIAKRNGSYYSENPKQGYNVWLTDDEREVKVSEVTRVRDDKDMKNRWDDTMFVGNLVKWLRWVSYD